MKIYLRKYRLTLEDAGRLRKVWSIRISRWRLVCMLICLSFMLMGLGVLIVALTPVKRSMPGFMTASDRTEVVNALARIDSLRMVMASNQAYIDNVVTLFDTDREPTDSLRAGDRLVALPPDSIKTASPAERKFVSMMDEREKFNLNVLSPVAADAVIFSDPMDGGIVVADSRRSEQLKVILPSGHGVNAIADGRVVERSFDATEGTYTLMIQSKRGFLTRYSHLGPPLVERGMSVLAGQRITIAPERSTPRTRFVGIEMWREGTPLIPGEYICRPVENVSEQDITAPRGK